MAIMSGDCLKFQNVIGDAVSRIRFASQSNNLLISSWDCNLRLYDVDSSVLRFEASSEVALLDCCFQDDLIAFSAGSDGSIRRYDFQDGTRGTLGNHDDIATCVEYSAETCQVITTGLDKKIMSWDMRTSKGLTYVRNLGAEVESMSISGIHLTLAMGTSVYMYDLRNLDSPVQSKESKMDTRIKCIRSVPYCEGFAAGSVDGRVALEISHPSSSDDLGYIFRCHPKTKDEKYHLVTVNDIAFNPAIFGAFVTGDNEGYVAGWDAQSRKRLFELPKCPNSVASLSYNRDGQLLAVASSYTYQDANEIETPQIFIHVVDDIKDGSVSAERSSSNRK